MPDVKKLQIRYPEFENADINRIGIFIEDAKLEIDKVRWSNLYERGVLALTAHLLVLNQWTTDGKGSPLRNLASEGAGELSVSYAASTRSGSDEDYLLTAYGQEYIRLRKLVGIGFMVI